jgi:hypothetical protein
LDIWQTLCCHIQGSPTVSALRPMTDTIFAADRGYNCMSSTEFISNLSAIILGTHKSSLDYPFIFGDIRVARKHRGVSISEKRSRAVYSATRILKKNQMV